MWAQVSPRRVGLNHEIEDVEETRRELQTGRKVWVVPMGENICRALQSLWN
jgi:hypothetical protein